MSSIEEKVRRILNSQDLGDITTELCDFTLKEQNATAEAQGVQPSATSDFLPILGQSVTYIVACVLINQEHEVLMIEEAKQSCAGKWYLPAGRMERGETICEAAAREVFEETGLNAEMTTLLAVETAGGSWFRFVLTGRITGGRLKTPADADAESIQARWVRNLNEVPLRANDILNIIDIGRAYYQNALASGEEAAKRQLLCHGNVLPTRYPHKRNYLRVLAVVRKRATNSMNILISEKNAHHFPTVELHPNRSLHSTLRKFMIEIFGAELPQHRPHGVLSLEHNTTEHESTDGICLNVLVAFRPPLEEVSIIGKCIWHELSAPLEETLGRILSSKNATIPLNVVR
ncbi:8-oxo-dGDP phosphatase NUDT18 [Scaptodrosophila lebanonensis]|uniref:8-oxo-dGDP phosphatase NUDT18 n=1 Tax=Drosophila lebanonensis TaxID=7225 RepID=A0A6J2TE68_DROLE|nr:8-oxo-dGDP phosphatase NUDT18 [Scaptodrosophila lebanonensis]XP_030374295.1 8-oxo-dGDP phosphatase NUDT18 [Scaptodrosophila lebanonensis]